MPVETPTPPSQTPVTVVTPTRFIVNPVGDTAETLLYVSVINPGLWYLIIVSVLIPVNTFPGHAAVAFPEASKEIVILSNPLNPLPLKVSKKQSAVNATGKPDTAVL